MLRLAFDENFNEDVVRGLQRLKHDLDFVRIREVLTASGESLIGADDPTILEWAALEARVLVTHDVTTVTGFAYERVRGGRPMPGVIEVARSVSLRVAIQDLLLLAECSSQDEWAGQIVFLPL